MNNQTTKLSDAELNAVVGGLSSSVQKKLDDTVSAQQQKIG